MTGRRMERNARLAAGVALLAALWLFLSTASAWPLTWTLTEFQPNIPHGGRGNTIAVHPTNNDVMLVASETGGLFRTTNRGVTWNHVDTFVPYASGAVTFLRADPNIVIATAGADFAVANGGGIWRSTDGGATWTQIPNPVAPPGVTDRFGAGEISIAPDTGTIYVSTAYGISISADQGATWSTAMPFGGQPASSVLAQSGNRILAGNAWLGVRRSIDGGGSWITPTTGAGGISDMHAFGRSPVAADHAYVVNAATQLFVTEDGGATWTRITSAPGGGGGCGGISFVKAISSRIILSTQLQLYFGNRCGLYRMTPPKIAGTNRFDYSGAWTALGMDHGDTRDLAFTSGFRRMGPSPLLLATDGGLHRTADGGANWTFTGGGVNGYNALQITEVKGQWVNDIGRYDLYFGTQDNDNRASGDTGITWPGVVCCEGFFFEAEKQVATATDAQIAFVSCGACVDLFSGALFGGLSGWANPPGTLAGNPTIIAKSFHVQGVNAEAGFARGFAVTQNLGTTWTQYATFPEDRRDIPKLSRRNLPYRFALPVQYQSIRTGWDTTRNFEIDRLVRVSKNIRAATASVHYPAMNGFGGLGINPTMFAWYQVFGVDPTNSRHLIAPDIVNEKMMQTIDGGENWTDMPALTSLVTDSGRFMFRNWVFPHAAAISYYNRDPNMIGVGTHANGIMLSTDHGTNWQKVPGSERATYITSIEWRNATDAFVSTYGRGLWRLRGTFWFPEFRPLCRIVDCLIRYIDRGDPPPFDRGVVIFEGRVLGVRVEQGRTAEIFVSPGSSIGYVATPENAPKVKITETQKTVGLLGEVRGFADWPQDGLGIIAVPLDKEDRLLGFAFAKTDLPTSMPTKAVRDKEEKTTREQSPIANKPYISLTVPSGRFDALASGEAFVVNGQRFKPGTTVEILIDNQVIDKAVIGANGTFSADLKAPEAFGLHTVTVRDAESQQVIDGTMFIVRHHDEKDERDAPQGENKPD